MPQTGKSWRHKRAAGTEVVVALLKAMSLASRLLASQRILRAAATSRPQNRAFHPLANWSGAYASGASSSVDAQGLVPIVIEQTVRAQL